MKFKVATVLLAAAAAAAAQDVPVSREGAYWVGSVGDSFAIAPHARLQLNTRGNVIVRKAQGDQVTYRVRQRVIAANEDQARDLLGGGGSRVSSLRSLVVLQIHPNSARNVLTDIEIGVPAQVA